MNILKMTRSLCPECHRILEATIFEENGEVLIRKECPDHGSYTDVYWSNFEEFTRARQFAVIGEGVENPGTQVVKGHPFDCGLCPNHKSHTALAIIDVTNRCNIRCPICFANAAVTGYVYEPSKAQIWEMLMTLRQIKPVNANALQFSGGEPTVRKDLPELIQMAKKAGFDHVEVNTNGIRLAESVDYCQELFDAGGRTLYLQFDGVTPEPYRTTRGRELFRSKMQAIENCRKVGYDSLVLVPTVVKGVNDDQLGDIINLAASNFDVIRCVNFQPVSITGRIAHDKRREMRITIPECTKLIEEQTKGQIKASDFYPIPVVVPVSRAVSAITSRNYVEFTVHEHCGMATFVFIEDGKLVPITRYLDVNQFLLALQEVYATAAKGSRKKAQLQMVWASIKYGKLQLLRQLIGSVLKEGSYHALGDLMRNLLMIGLMHFQDLYNLDLERLERCGIHYVVPPLTPGEPGRIIPFCAMNTIYRSMIEPKLGIPVRDWQQHHPNKTISDVT